MVFDARGFIMRTTLAIDDDLLNAAKELARSQNKAVGEVISSLARKALTPIKTRRRIRNGVPLLPVRKGAPRVTSELVHQLREAVRARN
jgi:hypothetical protein